MLLLQNPASSKRAAVLLREHFYTFFMFVLLCYMIIIYTIIIGEAGSSTVSRTILYIIILYRKLLCQHLCVFFIFVLICSIIIMYKIIVGEAGPASRNLALDATAAIGNLELHLLYIRLIERTRRCIAHEYGLDLLHLSPRQSFINRLDSSMNPAGRKRMLIDCLLVCYTD